MENNSSGGFIAPFLTGIIAGAVLGLLFAPDKGSETRKKIMRTVSDLTDSFSEMTQGDSSSGSNANASESYSGESYSSSSRRGNQY